MGAKKQVKKKALRIVLAVALIFAAYNIMWFAWSRIQYGKFSAGMEKSDFGSFVTPRYVYTDADRYDYLVKYPDYLSFTGNLSVGLPAADENVFTDALIIWPELSGGYQFGVLLYDENAIEYAIYIDPAGKALSKKDEDLVSQHRDNIRDLLIMADKKWHIYG